MAADAHINEYTKDAYMQYSLEEYASIISFYIKRSTMRTTRDKKDKDLYAASTYTELMNLKIFSMLNDASMTGV